jgi:hypothetical protein
MGRERRVGLLFLALSGVGLSGCGPLPLQPADGADEVTFTLAEGGVTPKAATVKPEGRVTFVNGDSVFGCWSCAARRASARNISTRSARSARCGWRRLITTGFANPSGPSAVAR